MVKKIVAIILAMTCIFSCFAVVSSAASETAQVEQSSEIAQDEGSKKEIDSLADLIDLLRQKFTAIVRLGDTIIAEAGAEKNETGPDFSPYLKILGYPIQQIVHFFQSLKEYF